MKIFRLILWTQSCPYPTQPHSPYLLLIEFLLLCKNLPQQDLYRKWSRTKMSSQKSTKDNGVFDCLRIQISYYYIIFMKGKVAIITASSTGIGKAIAMRLAQEGVNVIISSRDKKNIEETVHEIKSKGFQAHGIVCHVGKKADRTNLIQETIKKYGKIDYLVPNAAVSTQMGAFIDAQEDQIQKMLDINYKSTFFLIQETLPYLKIQPNSSIVILASYAAYDLPNLIGHYAITKTMLVALTKILAKELLDDQIRVNCICPGLIKTKFSNALWSHDEKRAAQGMGVKRLGVPEDISGAVKFLLSQQASYMTGESLVVAGRPCARL